MDSEIKYVPIENAINKSNSDIVLDDNHKLNDAQELDIKLSTKEKFAHQFAGELPSCPACSRLLRNRTIEKCDYCGFSFSYLTKLLPVNELPALENLLDFTNNLNDSEKTQIKSAMSFLSKRYPQIIPKLCLLPLQSDTEAQQMALWMINECPLPKGEKKQDKEWYVLLLIDTFKKQSSLAYGYKADIFISDESSLRLVSKLNRSLRKDEISKSIEELFLDIVPILDSTKKMVKRKYKRFKRKN